MRSQCQGSCISVDVFAFLQWPISLQDLCEPVTLLAVGEVVNTTVIVPAFKERPCQWDHTCQTWKEIQLFLSIHLFLSKLGPFIWKAPNLFYSLPLSRTSKTHCNLSSQRLPLPSIASHPLPFSCEHSVPAPLNSDYHFGATQFYVSVGSLKWTETPLAS